MQLFLPADFFFFYITEQAAIVEKQSRIYTSLYIFLMRFFGEGVLLLLAWWRSNDEIVHQAHSFALFSHST
jgi:hypothetical protein